MPQPETSVFDNLAVSTRRYAEKAEIVYYRTGISYRRLLAEVEAQSGYLHGDLELPPIGWKLFELGRS